MKLQRIVPCLAALFSFFVVSLAGQYLSLLCKGWIFPLWLFPVILFFSFESAYFSTFFLTPRTPMTVRLLEIGAVFCTVYGLSRLKGSAYGYEWFDLLQAVSDPQVLLPLVLTLAVWLMAGGYGRKFVEIHKLRDQLGDQSASTVSWEYESLEGKDYGASPMPMEYFFWRLFGYGLLIGILAVAASRTGAMADVSSRYKFTLVLLGVGGLGVGLVLQGAVYLYRLETIWSYTGARVSEGFQMGWFKSLAIFVMGVLVIVSFVPINYSPITFDRLSQWVMGVIERMEPFPIMEGGFRSDSPPPSVEEMVEWEGVEEEPSFWFALVMFLYFLLVVGGIGLLLLLAVGFMVVLLAKDELDKLKGLPHLAVRIYSAFIGAVREGWLFLSSLWRSGQQVFRKYTLSPLDTSADELRRQGTGNTAKPSGQALHIRQMFRRIVQTGREAGIKMSPEQTPQEYGEVLQEQFPTVDREVRIFFAAYNEVRYGERVLHSDRKKHIMEQGKRIVRQIGIRGKEG